MLKGVNKSVIEINCSDNEFFEKAVLFVRPEKQILNSSKLFSNADKYLSEIGHTSFASHSGKSTRIILLITRLTLSAFFGAIITFFLLKM